MERKNKKWVSLWLLVGLVMVVVQVLLGGITRITESGLSITEWQPITGAVFPLSEAEWYILFNKYRQIDQYKIHFSSNITLSEFKYLYFWEWFHRNWARFIGIIFIVPFVFFYFKKMITPVQARKYLVLLLLGLLQALAGWIMVASGLKKGNIFVEPLFLALHFILALLSLAFITYFILDWQVDGKRIIYNTAKHKMNRVLFVLIGIQLVYGAFLAGLHGASYAPTFPKINGEWIPNTLFSHIPFVVNFVENPIFVHFIHRGLAYMILIFAIIWIIYFLKDKTLISLSRLIYILPVLILVQIFFGVLILLSTADYKVMSYFAIIHQFMGMSIFIYMVVMSYFVRKKNELHA